MLIQWYRTDISCFPERGKIGKERDIVRERERERQRQTEKRKLKKKIWLKGGGQRLN